MKITQFSFSWKLFFIISFKIQGHFCLLILIEFTDQMLILLHLVNKCFHILSKRSDLHIRFPSSNRNGRVLLFFMACFYTEIAVGLFYPAWFLDQESLMLLLYGITNINLDLLGPTAGSLSVLRRAVAMF